MKFIITFILSTFYLLTIGQPKIDDVNSLIDKTIAKKITVSGICLCKTKLTDLKKLDTELQEVDVE